MEHSPRKRHQWYKQLLSLQALAWIVLLIAGIMFGYLIWLYVERKQIEGQSIQQDLSNQLSTSPGDLLWGVVGVLLTLVSSLFMFVTFRTQRRQFEQQFTTDRYNRFENTFFNLMTMFYDVRKATNKDMEHNTTLPVDNIDDYARRYLDECKNNEAILMVSKRLEESNVTEAELRNLIAAVGETFERYSKDSYNPMSYYFRCLFNLINYVREFWGDNEIETRKYLKFIQAQMADSELSLLVYNCISLQAKDSNHYATFHTRVDHYDLLQNIDHRWLIDRRHHLFYPSTHFRFLKETELAKKE